MGGSERNDPEWQAEHDRLLGDLRLFGETADRLVELALHQLVSQEPIDLAEPERALRRALELDPDHAEACLELAMFLDCVRDRPAEALPWFDRALGRVDDPTLVWAHARCLTQLGRRAEALAAIDASPHRDDPEVAKVRAEIVDRQWDQG